MTAFHLLPSLRARKIIRALEKAGFVQDRQKGSHVVMRHPTKKCQTVVPIHSGEEIHKSLLMDIIKQAELSIQEFLNLL
ncbi:TPA: hypothetical protein DDZ10_02565 [Candidatus Uhrbacteria bacterium]|nr:hypothetical protein [Candidatus Uhrbacteria bacterium]